MKKVKSQEIQDARDILESLGIVNETNKTVPNEYRGYISSFGASIAQSGLVPSVAFFENKNSNSQQDKPKIMKAILLMIDGQDSRYENLLDYLLDNQNQLDSEQNKIKKAAVALKLAMNTYKKEVKSDDEAN